MEKWENGKQGEQGKRGKGETENYGTLSKRFTLFLHLPFSPCSVFPFLSF
jgi:hypothetical protein